ncbi:MAG: regulatory protein RecX [Halothiobacillaceae bacterium]|jgi:regulatory protein|nr:regulatory protein RecX [Halothiobacillaceae bacterium]MDY0050158.1 regulatory protein RecX [Halothiobacillaceae bacterium]
MTEDETGEARRRPRRAARDVAFGLLARREHAGGELSRKLRGRGYEATEVRELVDELAEAGWQSDARYVEGFLRERIQRGHGPLRIRHELRERGVDDALIERALREAGVDWGACAARTRIRRFGSTPPQDAEERARQYRFLQGRGYTGEHIRKALADVNAGDDDFELDWV